jgi:cytochrome P450
MTAGHETSSHLMTMTLHRLLEDNGAWWRRLVADPATIATVVEESLRIDGPAQSLWRRAKQTAAVGGAEIPAGATVSVVLGSANADGEVFGAPDEFDPARMNNSAHLAFGRGIHTCPGAALARLEARVSLEVLTARLPRMRLAPDDGYMFTPSAIQRMARRLFVEWT